MFLFIALFVAFGYRLVNGMKCGEDEFQVSARLLKNTNLQFIRFSGCGRRTQHLSASVRCLTG